MYILVGSVVSTMQYVDLMANCYHGSDSTVIQANEYEML